MRAYLDLFRFDHAILAALGVFTGLILYAGNNPNLNWIIAMLVAIFVEMGTFSLNDYFDYESDLKNNRKDRPLVSGKINKSAAMLSSALFTTLGLFLSGVINSTSLIFIAAITAGNIAYNGVMKKMPAIGNLWVAFSTSATFLYGGIVAGGINVEIIYLSLLAFFACFAREISKTIMDMEGDAITGAKTLPMVIGVKQSAQISSVFYIVAAFFAFMAPMIQGNYVFSAAMFPSSIIAIICSIEIISNQKKSTLEKCRKYGMFAFAFGIIGAIIYSIL